MRISLVMLTAAALGVSASSIVQAQVGKPKVNELKANLLAQFDENKDGKLDDAERAKARAAKAERSEPAAQAGATSRDEVIKQFDADGDGKLNDEEKAKARAAKAERDNDKQDSVMNDFADGEAGEGRTSRDEVIKQFDENKDGKLDAAEKAKARAAKLEREAAEDDANDVSSEFPGGAVEDDDDEPRPSRDEIIKQFDANNDGKLDDAEKAQAREAKLAAGAKKGSKGRTPREDLLRQYDANKDGKLDNDEKAKIREANLAEKAAKKAKEAQAQPGYRGNLGGPGGAAGGKGGSGGNGGFNRQAALQRFDANGDGQLDAAEKAAMQAAMQGRPGGAGGPGGPTKEQMLQKFDANGDGQLNETEKAAMMRMIEAQRRAQGAFAPPLGKPGGPGAGGPRPGGKK